jgi:hypothetical protein
MQQALHYVQSLIMSQVTLTASQARSYLAQVLRQIEQKLCTVWTRICPAMFSFLDEETLSALAMGIGRIPDQARSSFIVAYEHGLRS